MKISSMVVALITIAAITASAAPTQLPAPTSLGVDNSICLRATLSWGAVPGARTYHVVIMGPGGSSETDYPATTLPLTSLIGGASYSFKVKALGVPGTTQDSDYSNTQSFVVKSQCAPSCHTPQIDLTSLNPSIIWPPNHKMVPIQVSGNVTTDCALTNTTLQVVDEYGVGSQSLTIPVDSMGGPFTMSVLVRASREGKDKDGRQYDFSASAMNSAGTGLSGTLIATVPHDMGKHDKHDMLKHDMGKDCRDKDDKKPMKDDKKPGKDKK